LGELVTLEELKEKKYAQVICYPNYSQEELKIRLEEMKRLNIRALEFVGEKKILDLPVLGKGCVSIVVLAHTNFGKAALKIRRTDADRSSMRHESEMLQMANSVSVGPKLLGSTKNILMIEFIKGLLLPKWIKKVKEAESEARIRKVLKDVMEQCWRLDKIGLDHGELSHASKHILVTPRDKAYIIDFETASTNRRASNVTSICQYLFLQSEVSIVVKEKLGQIEKERLIEALRNYKKKPRKENFEKVLKICRLS